MFRIKTDIRHYRCETRDKVERLIRNWVIRPSDLVYDDSSDEWVPIGEHPPFVEIFQTLEEAHENQPETVVTDRAADKAARDRERRNSEVDDSGESPAPPEPPADVVGLIKDSDEITEMTPRTYALRDPEPPVSNGRPSPPEGMTVERAGPREPTDLIDLDEASPPPESPDDETSEPPGESKRVEVDPAVDAEEEPQKKADGESEPDGESEDDENEGRHDLPEELFATAEVGGELEGEESDEDTTDVFEEPDESGEIESTKSELEGEESDEETTDVFGDPDESGEVESTSDERTADQPDDQGDIFEGVDDGGTDPEPPPRRGSQWNIVLDDVPPDEEDTEREEESVEAAESEAEPEQTDGSEHPEFQEVDPYGDTGEHEPSDDEDDVDPLRDTDELEDGDDEQTDESDAAGEMDPAGAGLDFGSEPVDDTGDTGEAAAVHELGDVDEGGGEQVVATKTEQEPKIEVDEAALDEAFEDLEETAVEARQAEPEEELEVIEPIDIEEVGASLEGYERDFLIPIEPSGQSLEAGIEHAEISSWKKDRKFSEPKPKENGEVRTRTFRFDDEESFQSISSDAVRGAVLGVAIIAIGAALLLGPGVC